MDTLFAITTDSGIGIFDCFSTSESDARDWAEREFGRRNLKDVRPATIEDFRHVASMGGTLPKAARAALVETKTE